MKRGTIDCYICGEPFIPAQEKLRAWADSGGHFDPTDWECLRCVAAINKWGEEAWLAAMQDQEAA